MSGYYFEWRQVLVTTHVSSDVSCDDVSSQWRS